MESMDFNFAHDEVLGPSGFASSGDGRSNITLDRVRHVVFGPLLDIPLIVGTFALMFRFRKRIAGRLRRVRAPRLLIFVLLCVPLIVFEEDINCMPAWCGHVIIPPTLPFLLLELVILGAIALWRKGAKVS